MTGDPKTDMTGALARLAEDRKDEPSWKIVYFSLWPLVFGIVRRVSRLDLKDAEDASQEVFSRLVHYCPFQNLRDPSAFVSYVSTVSRNVARSCLQKKEKEFPRQLTSGHQWGGTVPVFGPKGLEPEHRAHVEELLGNILAAVDSDVDRKLLLLVIDGNGLSECAKSLGLSYSATAVRLCRVRKKLRTLQKNFDPDDKK